MSSDTELEARDIRAGYISWCRGELSVVLAEEKFDRFIAKVKADALREAAGVAMEHGRGGLISADAIIRRAREIKGEA